MSIDTSTPRTRRAVLAGAFGGIGALAASVIGGASRVQAAAGSPLIIGSSTNNAGTSNTTLTTNSTVVAFQLLQNGGGTALMGYAVRATGPTRGVYGRTDSPNGDGVQARNAGAAGTGTAIRAFGGNNLGVDATSTKAAVRGILNGATANDAQGFLGVLAPFGGGPIGVAGASSSGTGVQGNSESGNGVHGISPGGYALYGDGNGMVTGSFSKASGTFKIDHPLDPATKYLQHSFVESPDMKNVYDGLAALDSRGQATVTLPSYFETLNRDLRYQLTPLGAFSPLYVKAKVASGRFTIAGGSPGQEVCWQVTGIRKDPWAEAHPIVVEQPKSAAQQGTYLHPELYGQPASRALHPLPDHPAAPARMG